jgi:3-oxoacyl-[acyl-carrier-protein] synthase III
MFSAIEAVLPSRVLTNDDVITEILSQSRGALTDREETRLVKALRALFSLAGTKVRYVRADGEMAVDLACRAGKSALQSAGMCAADIELLIFVGVGRGFLEPATANVFQDRLNLRRATCFDVLDACASWLRAVHIARSFIQCGEYSRIMILNAEFNFWEYADFHFENIQDLSHNFAPFTIGEAATATILCGIEQDTEYYATFRTWGELRNLCMIPLPNVRQFNGPSTPDYARQLRFSSSSRELFKQGIEKLVKHFYEDAKINKYLPDIAFGHAASDSASARVALECKAPPSCYYYTHSRFANTVSASVPLAMAFAKKEGRLKHGDRVMIGMASAGLSTNWTRFRYLCH